MFAHTNLITYESLYSSSYLLNEYLLYDKLLGPSQRVVTLFKPVYFWQREHEFFVVLANFVYFVAKFRIFGVLYTG